MQMKDVIWIMFDMNKFDPEEMKELQEILQKLEARVQNEDIPIIECFNMASGSRMEEVAMELISNAAGVDFMFLDMWMDGKLRSEIASLIRKETKDTERFMEDKRKRDMLDDIILRKLDAGLVHLPTDLIRNLWDLGNAVSDILGGKNEKGHEMANLSMKVMCGTADWVAFCKKRWGIPGNSHILMVVPINHRDILEARPDESDDEVPF